MPEDAFYHVYEMNVDGTGRRQLTRGRYDDFDARYLPSGDIVFLSTRKGIALQCSQCVLRLDHAHADLPDSYVRCGGDNYRPVPVFTLHAMDADGGNLRPLSAFENFEWTPVGGQRRPHPLHALGLHRPLQRPLLQPVVGQPGRHQPAAGLRQLHGEAAGEVRGPRRSPARRSWSSPPRAHHSIIGGSLCLLDRSRGTEDEAPLTRLTPEVRFPETEADGEHYYANPWPLSEEYFLVGWADRKLPPHCRVDATSRTRVNAMGLYLYDAFGNLELLYRDPEISSVYPIPVAPAPAAAASSRRVADWDRRAGRPLPGAGRLPRPDGRRARARSSSCGSWPCRPRSSRT